MHNMIFAGIVVFALVYLSTYGLSYYQTNLEERFFHPDHSHLKPSGLVGHGLGIIGTVLMVVGVSSYMIRKRWKKISRLGLLKHWLEFHIFLCTLGPIMVLFHTAFKFGGLVSISFWSMVAVFISGIVGRFIYIQIPRSLEGRALSLQEVTSLKKDIGNAIKSSGHLDEQSYALLMKSTEGQKPGTENSLIGGWVLAKKSNWQRIRKVRSLLKSNQLSKQERNKIIELIKNEISLNQRIERLARMQQLFRYWHVAHLPFALVMLVIMVIHVGITLAFGYKWIF